MAKVVFTPNVQRHVLCPETEAAGRTVRDVLDNVFADNPQARCYVLDDQSRLAPAHDDLRRWPDIRDRARLSDAVTENQHDLCVPGPVRRLMMSDTLLVSTRKGLFTVARKAERGRSRRSTSWATMSPSR